MIRFNIIKANVNNNYFDFKLTKFHFSNSKCKFEKKNNKTKHSFVNFFFSENINNNVA